MLNTDISRTAESKSASRSSRNLWPINTYLHGCCQTFIDLWQCTPEVFVIMQRCI